MDSLLKIVYIAGIGHSGSTIVSRILAIPDAVITVGEMKSAWMRFTRGDFSEPAKSDKTYNSACNFWENVYKRTVDTIGQSDIQAMAAYRPPLAHVLNKNGVSKASTTWYLLNLEVLYHIVQDISQCSIIVDTSKDIRYAMALSHTPGIELYILHLLRDPRAVLNSYRKLPRQSRKENGQPHTNYAIRNALYWYRSNIAAELVLKRLNPGRYMRLRYEDFARQPEDTIKQILSFVDAEPIQAEIQFAGGNTITLTDHHIIQGNYHVKNASNDISVKLDQKWHNELGSSATCLMSLLTFPIMFRYGYPMRDN